MNTPTHTMHRTPNGGVAAMWFQIGFLCSGIVLLVTILATS